eukprot:TRINITY_DN1200_c0_g1_i1.p1 TRINITY_DN1200_c0_g1~~TRINITY_DN1200_c0_g1_i1.p1  ORF type:complete len:100 (-),score=3.05 TRINITY_DN1200_c0_g1_i1:117-416(-)
MFSFKLKIRPDISKTRSIVSPRSAFSPRNSQKMKISYCPLHSPRTGSPKRSPRSRKNKRHSSVSPPLSPIKKNKKNSRNNLSFHNFSQIVNQAYNQHSV